MEPLNSLLTYNKSGQISFWDVLLTTNHPSVPNIKYSISISCEYQRLWLATTRKVH